MMLLLQLCESKFDFGAFFTALGKSPSELGDVNVCHTAAIQKTAAVIAVLDGETIVHYLRWQAAREWRCGPCYFKLKAFFCQV